MKDKHGINTPVAKAIGLSRKSSSTSSITSASSSTNTRKSNQSKIISFNATDGNHRRQPRQSSITTPLPDPVVKPHQLKDKEIKRRTGFVSESAMIKFIIIVCNGDFSLVKQTVSNQLTWFEEWFLYFEVVWLRTHTRWEDTCEIFKLNSQPIVRRVFDSKARLILNC